MVRGIRSDADFVTSHFIRSLVTLPTVLSWLAIVTSLRNDTKAVQILHVPSLNRWPSLRDNHMSQDQYCSARDLVNAEEDAGFAIWMPRSSLAGARSEATNRLDRSDRRSSERTACRRRAESLALLRLQFVDVSLKFFQSGPAQQVEADHFVGSLGRLAAGVDENQQASDDRQVHLNFHATRLRAE